MATSPITSGTAAAAAIKATTSVNNSKMALDKNTFLKLLVEQLRHQDPTQPTDSSQWTAQMAQFSTVEQLTNLATNSETAAKSSAVNQAVALLGKVVSYAKADGTPVSGKVERVDLTGKSPTLTIAGVSGISPADLDDVA